MRDKKERMNETYATEDDDERVEDIRKDHLLKEIAEGLYPIKKILELGSKEKKIFFGDGKFFSEIEEEAEEYENMKRLKEFHNLLFTDDKHKNRIKRQFRQRAAKPESNLQPDLGPDLRPDLGPNFDDFPHPNSVKVSHIEESRPRPSAASLQELKKEVAGDLEPVSADKSSQAEMRYRSDIKHSKTNSKVPNGKLLLFDAVNTAATLGMNQVETANLNPNADTHNDTHTDTDTDANTVIDIASDDTCDCDISINIQIAASPLQGNRTHVHVLTGVQAHPVRSYEKFQDIAECKDENDIQYRFPSYCFALHRPERVNESLALEGEEILIEIGGSTISTSLNVPTPIPIPGPAPAPAPGPAPGPIPIPVPDPGHVSGPSPGPSPGPDPVFVSDNEKEIVDISKNCSDSDVVVEEGEMKDSLCTVVVRTGNTNKENGMQLRRKSSRLLGSKASGRDGNSSAASSSSSSSSSFSAFFTNSKAPFASTSYSIPFSDSPFCSSFRSSSSSTFRLSSPSLAPILSPITHMTSSTILHPCISQSSTTSLPSTNFPPVLTQPHTVRSSLSDNPLSTVIDNCQYLKVSSVDRCHEKDCLRLGRIGNSPLGQKKDTTILTGYHQNFDGEVDKKNRGCNNDNNNEDNDNSHDIHFSKNVDINMSSSTWNINIDDNDDMDCNETNNVVKICNTYGYYDDDSDSDSDGDGDDSDSLNSSGSFIHVDNNNNNNNNNNNYNNINGNNNCNNVNVNNTDNDNKRFNNIKTNACKRQSENNTHHELKVSSQAPTQTPTQTNTDPNIPLSFIETAQYIETSLSKHLHSHHEIVVDFVPRCREKERKGKRKGRNKPLLPLNPISLCGSCNCNGKDIKYLCPMHSKHDYF